MLLVCVPLCVCVCFVLVFWPLCVLWFVSSCVTNCHPCFFWLLVFRCVCVRARTRCMQFLCFLGFCVLWCVQWLWHLLPPVFNWLQGFVCVCAQVSCSVVSNWSMVDLFGDVCIYLGFNLLPIIFLIFFFQFCLFLRHQTMDKSKNTIRSIPTCYKLNTIKYDDKTDIIWMGSFTLLNLTCFMIHLFCWCCWIVLLQEPWQLSRGSRVRFLAGAGNFSLHHRVHNGSGAHPASYPMGTRGSFSRGKAAEAWSWPLISI
jgi:hypothetical protein